VSCGLRDVLSFEQAGRPAVLIASNVFEQAATEQAELLGAPTLRRVLVSHPVQDRTDDELVDMAAAAVEDVLAALTG
jgi:hypothetical protein